jgi:pimeloyl-ACP methyl ester carboxylesterase
VLSGCGQSVPAHTPDYERPSRELAPNFLGAPELPPPDLTDDGPGSLVRVEPVSGNAAFDTANSVAVKIVYRSTSGTSGAPTEVSGLVAVPPGVPPNGGFPVMSFGHEMSGVQSKCAPTVAQDFLGYAAQMTTFLNRGYVVVLPDFQGLGLDGAPPHSVLDATTLGNNMIDAARAARRVLPSASNRWAAFGVGEGGLAAWAAAERAPTYGSGMEMVGAVAVSPYADLTPLADAAAAGTLGTGEQSRLYMMALQSLANTAPGFDLDAYRAGLARDHWSEVIDCAPRNPNEALKLLNQITADDLRPRDAAAADDLRRRFGDAALPGPPAPGAVPVLVIYGTDDPVVPSAGIDRAVVTACREGDRVDVMRRIGDTKPVNDQVVNGALSWLLDRFDGQQLGDVCVGAT